MTDREKLAGAVKSVAWGHIFCLLNLNLGTLNVLPDWWGYCLMLKALGTISQEEPSAKLLRPFGIILAIWEGIHWGLDLVGGSWDGGFISVLITVVGLYFHFQLLTNLAAISEKYGCPQTGRILTLRTVQTVLTTLLALPIGWENMEFVMFPIIIVMLVVTIWTCSVLFSLRRSLLEVDNSPNDSL